MKIYKDQRGRLYTKPIFFQDNLGNFFPELVMYYICLQQSRGGRRRQNDGLFISNLLRITCIGYDTSKRRSPKLLKIPHGIQVCCELIQCDVRLYRDQSREKVEKTSVLMSFFFPLFSLLCRF